MNNRTLNMILGLIILLANVYIPVNGYVVHAAGTATPIDYILVGASIYFWIDMIRYLFVTERDRKRFSHNDVEAIVSEYHKQMEINNASQEKDGYH